MGPSLPPDSRLPFAAALLGGGGSAALRQFLADRGWELQTIKPVQALYWPGVSMAVRFETGARGPRGERRTFTLTAETRSVERPVRPVTRSAVEGVDNPVAFAGPYLVWVFPHDPSLPGLPEAVRARVVSRSLSPRPATVAVEPLRYRPRRRAVLRYRLDGTGLLFGKVLTPGRARRALEVASQLRAAPEAELRLALPVGEPAPGALLVAPVDGHSLRQLLVAGDRLPAPERIARLPDEIARLAPSGGAGEPCRGRGRPRLEAAGHAADLIVHLLPGLAGPVERLLDAIARGTADDPADTRFVHGDLHEAQVLVGEDGTLGLVDLDDLGPGDPLLDAATFTTHLLVLAHASGPAAERILAYRALLRRALLERLGAAESSLAWREAYSLLLLATGPFRTLHPHWPTRVAERVEAASALARP